MKLAGSKVSRSFTIFCFSGRSENQDGSSGLWLAQTFSTSSLEQLNGIQWNLIGSKISTFSNKFGVVFFGWWKKQDSFPSLWLAQTFSTSSLQLLNGIQQNLTGVMHSTSSTRFEFFFRLIIISMCSVLKTGSQVHDCGGGLPSCLWMDENCLHVGFTNYYFEPPCIHVLYLFSIQEVHLFVSYCLFMYDCERMAYIIFNNAQLWIFSLITHFVYRDKENKTQSKKTNSLRLLQ